MFLPHGNYLAGRKGRELPSFMLALVAGWVLLQFALPGARAQGPMIGMGGSMMMRPTPPMTMRPLNANGHGLLRRRHGLPGRRYAWGLFRGRSLRLSRLLRQQKLKRKPASPLAGRLH